MQFAFVQWKGWLWLAAALAGFAVLALVRKRRALRRLAAAGGVPLLVHRPTQLLKAGLLVLAAALLGVALLGPQWGFTEEAAPPAAGRDVLVVLDVSRSMLAEDVAPCRLDRAKAEVRELASRLERAGGCRVGLIAFADRTALLCPLTSDYRCFEEELAAVSLDTLRLRGDRGDGDGTQVALALRRAARAIDPSAADSTDVLLVSDGDDLAGGTPEAAGELARLGVPVHALGVGDPDQGALIPVRDRDGRRTFLRYRGEPVRTRLQEGVLRALARRTGGRYLAAGAGPLGLLGGKATRERAAGRQRHGIHRFQWFVAGALALLLLEVLLGDARRQPAAKPGRPSYFRWVRRKAPHPTTQVYSP